LETREIEIVVESAPISGPGSVGGMMSSDRVPEAGEVLSKIFQIKTSNTTRMSVSDAREHLRRMEGEKCINMEQILRLAKESVEQDGIVFIDEIDKICTPGDSGYRHADASAEGVQRDLLPLIEGSIINTKHGNIDTSKILFIASGAFHQTKPSDLLAELQGRLPIRVTLQALTVDDLRRILVEPECNLLIQQIELMKTEGVQLQFSEGAVHLIATMAVRINESVENIGARRLHTVIEKIVEDCSFNVEKYKSTTVLVTEKMIEEKLTPMLQTADLTRFVL